MMLQLCHIVTSTNVFVKYQDVLFFFVSVIIIAIFPSLTGFGTQAFLFYMEAALYLYL